MLQNIYIIPTSESDAFEKACEYVQHTHVPFDNGSQNELIVYADDNYAVPGIIEQYLSEERPKKV